MGGSVGLSHVEHTHAVTYAEDPARRQLGRRAQLLAVASVGVAGTFLTPLAMGESWRGVDTTEHTELVTGGPFLPSIGRRREA